MQQIQWHSQYMREQSSQYVSMAHYRDQFRLVLTPESIQLLGDSGNDFRYDFTVRDPGRASAGVELAPFSDLGERC
jgi:hypothetical protein